MLGQNVVAVVLACDCQRIGLAECEILLAISQGKRIHRQLACFCRVDGGRFNAEYSAYPISVDNRIVGGVVTFSVLVIG